MPDHIDLDKVAPRISATYGKTTQGVPHNRDANAAQRAALAVKLRTSKLTYDQIARQCGYADRSTARKAIIRELERTVVMNVEELRREELAMLDMLQQQCMTRMMDKGFDKGMLFAVDRLLAISERRAKLMGLEVKPDEIIANQNYTKRIVLEVSEVSA